MQFNNPICNFYKTILRVALFIVEETKILHPIVTSTFIIKNNSLVPLSKCVMLTEILKQLLYILILLLANEVPLF